MKILITGPQGSGKSTQAKLLADFLNIPFVGIGALLREEVSNGGEYAEIINKALTTGEFADDQVVAKVFKKRLSQSDCENGFVADGYPRSKNQLQFFNPEYDKVFLLSAPESTLVKRLLKRGRLDDTPELIKRRLELYNLETAPILKDYENRGIVEHIDSSGEIEETQGKIRRCMQ